MPHDLAELFAELDVAKAELQRSVRKSRAFLTDHRPPAEPAGAGQLFDWPADEDRQARRS